MDISEHKTITTALRKRIVELETLLSEEVQKTTDLKKRLTQTLRDITYWADHSSQR